VLEISKLVTYQGDLSFQSPPEYVSSRVLLHRQQLAVAIQLEACPGSPSSPGPLATASPQESPQADTIARNSQDSGLAQFKS